MTSFIIGLAGHARSGKTSIAEAISAQTGLSVARFSREVERVARERGLPLEPSEVRRETLMAVGESLVSNELESFCRRVLAQVGWAAGRSAVIEGIRHQAVARELERLVAPGVFRLVLVTAPAEVRERRLAAEGLSGTSARARLDAHSTEREVSSDLPRLASLIVDGTLDANRTSTVIVEAMYKWGWRAGAT